MCGPGPRPAPGRGLVVLAVDLVERIEIAIVLADFLAGLPPESWPEPRPRSKEVADAFYAELREKGRNRDYWGELAELRRKEREEGEAQDEESRSARARASTSLSMSAPNVPPGRDSS